MGAGVNQDRPPNFRADDGRLYLVRCFACGGERGTENYAPAVASGQCAWCGCQSPNVSQSKRPDPESGAIPVFKPKEVESNGD